MATPSFPLFTPRSSPLVTPPPPVWVSFFAMYGFGSLQFGPPPDPVLNHTLSRLVVLACPPKFPLLYHFMGRHYGFITPLEKQSSMVSKAASPKKGKPAQSGNNDSDTEDAVHWTCACQHVHYPNNPHAAHDARLPISVATSVLRQLPTTGFKIAPCPATTPGHPCRHPPCPMT